LTIATEKTIVESISELSFCLISLDFRMLDESAILFLTYEASLFETILEPTILIDSREKILMIASIDEERLIKI
jgi:hypothetical protein